MLESSRGKQVLLGTNKKSFLVAFRKCYNAYNSYNKEMINEALAFHSPQYAPAGGEWKAFETDRESARLDTE